MDDTADLVVLDLHDMTPSSGYFTDIRRILPYATSKGVVYAGKETLDLESEQHVQGTKRDQGIRNLCFEF